MQTHTRVTIRFIYVQSGKEVGKVFKNQVKTVKPTDKKHKVGDYCFEVHHSASGSPWILSATTQVSLTGLDV